jgi:hypothetical protein
MPTPNPNFGRKAKLERPTEPAKPVEE